VRMPACLMPSTCLSSWNLSLSLSLIEQVSLFSRSWMSDHHHLKREIFEVNRSIDDF
jgi:hypothetical protein